MITDVEAEDAFAHLQPICARLMVPKYEDDVVALLKSLHSGINELSSEQLETFLDYVLFPLRVLLTQKTIQPAAEEHCWKVLSAILERKVQMPRWQTFVDIFRLMDQRISEATGELDLGSAIGCLRNMIVSHRDSHLAKLFTPEGIPLLGQFVFHSLKLVEKHPKSIEIVNCVFASLQVLIKFGEDGENSEEKCAAALAFSAFLPGISIEAVKLFSNDAHLNHQVAVSAIQTMDNLLDLCLQKDPDNDVSRFTKNEKLAAVLPVKNEQWFKKTWEKLHIVLLNILRFRSGNAKVILAQLSLAKIILGLESCPEEITILMIHFAIECLGIMDASESCDIAAKSKETLSDKVEPAKLHRVTSELLYENSLRFSRLVRSESFDGSRLSCLRSVVGCLGILSGGSGSSDYQSGLSDLMLEKIIDGLCLICVPDFQRLDVVCNVEQQSDTWPRIGLRFLADSSQEMVLVLKILDVISSGKRAGTSIMYLLQIEAKGNSGAAVAYGLQKIVDFAGNNTENATSATQTSENLKMALISEISSVLDFCLETLDDVELDFAISDCNVNTDRSKVDENAAKIILTLKILSEISKKWPKCFQDCQYRVLSNIFRLVASEHPVIQRSARVAISKFSESENLKVADFAQNHAAFLLSTVQLQLNHFDLYPRAPLTFLAFLEIAQSGAMSSDFLKSILPAMHDMISELIYKLDEAYEKQCQAFLIVIRGFINFLSHAESLLEKPEVASQLQGEVANSLDNDSDILDEDSEMLDKDPESTDASASGKPELPCHIAMTTRVLHRTKHLLNAPHLHLRILSTEILGLGLGVLRHWQDELLPLVHQNWAPLLTCFRARDPNLSRSGITAVRIMAETAGDFVCRRVMEELWPIILQDLDTLSTRSRDSGRFYQRSAQFKLQVAYLTELAVILDKIKLPEEWAAKVGPVCEIYSPESQPKELRVLALSLATFLCSLTAKSKSDLSS